MGKFLFLIAATVLGFSNFASAGDIDPGDDTKIGYVVVQTPWSGNGAKQPEVVPYKLVDLAVDVKAERTPGTYNLLYSIDNHGIQQLFKPSTASGTGWNIVYDVQLGKTTEMKFGALETSVQLGQDYQVVNSDLQEVDLGFWNAYVKNSLSAEDRLGQPLNVVIPEMRMKPVLLPEGKYDFVLGPQKMILAFRGSNPQILVNNFDDLQNQKTGQQTFHVNIKSGQLEKWSFALSAVDARAKINVLAPTKKPRFKVVKTWVSSVPSCSNQAEAATAPMALVRIKTRGENFTENSDTNYQNLMNNVISDTTEYFNANVAADWLRIDKSRLLNVWPLEANSKTTYEVVLGGLQREVELPVAGSTADVEIKYLNVNDVLLKVDDGLGNVQEKYVPGSFTVSEVQNGLEIPLKNVWGAYAGPGERCMGKGIEAVFATQSTILLLEGTYHVKIDYSIPEGSQQQIWEVQCPAKGDCSAKQLP